MRLAREGGAAKLSLFADVISPDDPTMRQGRPTTAGILADDLTSAMDGAGPFVMRGMPAAIGRLRLPQLECPVSAVDSGARSLSAPEAAERAAGLTSQLASCDILYNTIDSTLRGLVSAGLEACMKASGLAVARLRRASPTGLRETA